MKSDASEVNTKANEPKKMIKVKNFLFLLVILEFGGYNS